MTKTTEFLVQMEAILVGADHLGNIPDLLARHGIRVRRHVSGRASGDQRKGVSLPTDVHLVILFTDFLRHGVMRSYRDAARRAGVHTICCRRSVGDLAKALRPLDVAAFGAGLA